MIVPVKDRRLLEIADGRVPKRFPADLVGPSRKALNFLVVADELDELRHPPGNRLETLSGDQAGQHSIRINRQWRLCFRWKADGAHDVELVDYHGGQMMDFHFNPPIHPGEMLRTEHMEPLVLTPGQLAKALGVPRTRIERLVREETGLSADTADRLARYFGSSVKFWQNMQSHYEIDCLRLDEAHQREVAKITPRPELGDIAAQAA